MKRTEMKCAFCEGKGKDPFGVPSAESRCQVCAGKGKNTLQQKGTRKCNFCNASGKHPIERLTCPVCKGYGVFEFNGEGEMCFQCQGTGREESHYFPCAYCHGYGITKKVA